MASPPTPPPVPNPEEPVVVRGTGASITAGGTFVDTTDGAAQIVIVEAPKATPLTPRVFTKTDSSSNTVTISDGLHFSVTLSNVGDSVSIVSDGKSYTSTFYPGSVATVVVPDADYGDVVVTAGVWTIDASYTATRDAYADGVAATAEADAKTYTDATALPLHGTADNSTKIAGVTPTAFGLSQIDDADATAGRATLGLGTLATQSGTFSGTSSGTNTGDQTTVSGNAGTATALQTARNINGVSFNGTADITVTAAGSTLTGSTLAAGLIGTAGTQACAGNDSRLSDSRAPTGSAGGGLTGTYPNPTIADAELLAVASTTSAADKLIRFTGSGTADTVSVKSSTTASAVPIADASGFLNGWINGYCLKSFTKLTSGTGATYTTVSGARALRVRGWACGGGGGGTSRSASNTAAGGGGGAGGYFEKWYTSPAGSYTYTVSSSGGAGGSSSAGSGVTGSDTTFDNGGTILTAKGGIGGTGQAFGTSNVAVQGGNATAVSTNGDINGGGAPGGWALRISGTVAVSGAGGSTDIGGGGQGLTTEAGGVNGTGYGAGGGGGLCLGTSARSGGNGAPGLILVEEYF